MDSPSPPTEAVAAAPLDAPPRDPPTARDFVSASAEWVAWVREAAGGEGGGLTLVLGVPALRDMVQLTAGLAPRVLFVAAQRPDPAGRPVVPQQDDVECCFLEPGELAGLAGRRGAWAARWLALTDGRPVAWVAGTALAPPSILLGLTRVANAFVEGRTGLVIEAEARLAHQVVSELKGPGDRIETAAGAGGKGVALLRPPGRAHLPRPPVRRPLAAWRWGGDLVDVVQAARAAGRDAATASRTLENFETPPSDQPAPRIAWPHLPEQMAGRAIPSRRIHLTAVGPAYVRGELLHGLGVDLAGSPAESAMHRETAVLPLDDPTRPLGRLDRYAPEPALILTSMTLGVNYYHWIVDYLPKLLFLQSRGIDLPELYIVGAERAFQRESLQLAGVDAAVRIREDEGVLFKSLWTISPLPASGLREAYARLASDHRPAGEPGRCIYVTRRQAPSRRVLNEDALLDALAPFGVEPVELEGASLADQIRMFAESRLIVGPHGAGLANMVFCPPSASVVELGLEERIALDIGEVFWGLASGLGLDYSLVLAHRVASGHPPADGDLVVDIDAVVGTVESALRREGRG